VAPPNFCQWRSHIRRGTIFWRWKLPRYFLEYTVQYSGATLKNNCYQLAWPDSFLPSLPIYLPDFATYIDSSRTRDLLAKLTTMTNSGKDQSSDVRGETFVRAATVVKTKLTPAFLSLGTGPIDRSRLADLGGAVKRGLHQDCSQGSR
jgi:hypothetical protein